MVDLAGVVRVVGDHGRDDPARRCGFAPVRRPRRSSSRHHEAAPLARRAARAQPRARTGSPASLTPSRATTARPRASPIGASRPECVVVVHDLARSRRGWRCRRSTCMAPAGSAVHGCVVRDGCEVRQERLALVGVLDPTPPERLVHEGPSRRRCHRARPWSEAGSLSRVWYSPVRVSMRIVSPTSTKIGTWTTRPVSVVAGLRAPVWVSPAKPGSVSTTLRSTGPAARRRSSRPGSSSDRGSSRP